MSVLGFAAPLLALVGGCAGVRTAVDPFNILNLGKPPLRIGVTDLHHTPLLPRRQLLQEDLSLHLNELVTFDLMTPRQIRVHLGTGRLKFAMLSPGDYSEIAASGSARILAVPVNSAGHTYRRGLIIVSAKSDINDLSEMEQLRFHWMPRGHLLNQAARGALLDAGVSLEDLDKGILGLGLDTYHISSLEVAKSVVLEERAAGVIDEADYTKWKASGGSFLLLSPSQDQVRVIGQTVSVPEGPFVVSSETDPELADKVYNYLVNVLPRRKLVLAPMGYSGFAPPIEPSAYEPFFAMHRRLHPPAAPEAEEDDLPMDLDELVGSVPE